MRLEKFVATIPDIDLVQKWSGRLDTVFGIKFDHILHLSYRQLKKQLPDLIASGQLDKALHLVITSKKPRLKLWRVRRYDKYKKLRFLFWIQDQYKFINEMEYKYLSSPPDRKLSAAGISELDILGDINLIDALADGNILNWDRIMDMPYEKLFDKQHKLTIEAKIAKRLNKIK